MQSFTLLVVLGLAAVSFAQEPIKACLRTTDECTPVLETTKGVFRNLRAIGGGDPKVDIPQYLKELHDFFQSNLQTDCKIETCHCTDGKLVCTNSRDNVQALLKSVEIPQCILESPIAARLMQRLTKAVEDGNREQTLSVLGLLEKVTIGAIAKPDNDKLIDCISQTVQKIRAPIRQRLQTLDFQPACDFCTA